jgi:hypothetical protein
MLQNLGDLQWHDLHTNVHYNPSFHLEDVTDHKHIDLVVMYEREAKICANCSIMPE